jgi:hypothetical protein
MVMLSDQLRSIFESSKEFKREEKALKKLFKKLFFEAVHNNIDYVDICMHRSQLEIFEEWLISQGDFCVTITNVYDEHIDLRICLYLIL